MISLTKVYGQIYIRDRESGQEGVYDEITGVRIRGKLDVDPDNVLYWAWCQTQPVKLTEAQLLKKWKEIKHD